MATKKSGKAKGKVTRKVKGKVKVAKRAVASPSAKPAARAARSFSTPLVSPAAAGSWHFPVRKPGVRQYWLLKQEPTDFGFDDLWAAPKRTTNWNGVRNFTARNFLRNQIKAGDHAFFYHSNADPSAVVGVVEVIRDGYPDESQFDRKSDYYDAAATAENPLWFQVDVRALEKLPQPVSLADMKTMPELASLVLLHISQLSVQPVTASEWEAIVKKARG